MQISSFDYDLPPEFIAAEPVYPRDACRLMVINRDKGTIDHRSFFELPGLLRPTDVLVFNDSKVIPARILFRHGNKKVEIFLTKRLDDGKWLAIGKPGKVLEKGAKFVISDELSAEITDVMPDHQRVVDFSMKGPEFDAILNKVGSTPLPPYIKNSQSSAEDYQTVYARERGSVAAPTAGLHFTESLIEKLKEAGVSVEFVTLHVGLGTFLPVKTDIAEEHKMHTEYFNISDDTCKRLNAARKAGRRIIAVGTTAVRVLESSFDAARGFRPGFGETDIYIYPGYKWKCVDALITNFHLPKSTLLLLTCSFAGKDFVMKAYGEAIKKKYRFFSFGDAMFIE
jgi:S-adenosylmethionine:tRNA ribosyltransferase-isomerase